MTMSPVETPATPCKHPGSTKNKWVAVLLAFFLGGRCKKGTRHRFAYAALAADNGYNALNVAHGVGQFFKTCTLA